MKIEKFEQYINRIIRLWNDIYCYITRINDQKINYDDGFTFYYQTYFESRKYFEKIKDNYDYFFVKKIDAIKIKDLKLYREHRHEYNKYFLINDELDKEEDNFKQLINYLVNVKIECFKAYEIHIKSKKEFDESLRYLLINNNADELKLYLKKIDIELEKYDISNINGIFLSVYELYVTGLENIPGTENYDNAFKSFEQNKKN